MHEAPGTEAAKATLETPLCSHTKPMRVIAGPDQATLDLYKLWVMQDKCKLGLVHRLSY